MSFPSILLVSGNTAVRQQLQSLLTQQCIEACAVADGLSDAGQQAKQHSPDIILLDGGLPALDFKSLLVTAAGKRSPVVLILLESPCSPAQEKAWRADGAAGFIPAPFDPATFASRVHELAEQAWFARKLADLAELGGQPFVSEMIDAFLHLARRAVADIHAGVATGDLNAVSRAAHSLKSAAANLGAEELREAATQIESQAKNNDSSTLLEQQAQKLETAFDRAREFLLRHRSPQS